MRGKALRYLVCYDIPDDKRRLKVAKCLDGYGDRVQFSVFEALLDQGLITRLTGSLMELIDEEEDSIRIYALCAACAGKTRKLGRSEAGPEIGEETVFIV